MIKKLSRCLAYQVELHSNARYVQEAGAQLKPWLDSLRHPHHAAQRIGPYDALVEQTTTTTTSTTRMCMGNDTDMPRLSGCLVVCSLLLLQAAACARGQTDGGRPDRQRGNASAKPIHRPVFASDSSGAATVGPMRKRRAATPWPTFAFCGMCAAQDRSLRQSGANDYEFTRSKPGAAAVAQIGRFRVN